MTVLKLTIELDFDGPFYYEGDDGWLWFRHEVLTTLSLHSDELGDMIEGDVTLLNVQVEAD